MPKFRCMFGDTFLDVEADSEDDAAKKACERLKEALAPESFIVWENNPGEPPCDTQ